MSFSPCRDAKWRSALPFARSRRRWRGRAAEYSVFCTARDGVPRGNTAVARKNMQFVMGIMQTEEAGGVDACIEAPSANKVRLWVS